VTIAVSIRTSSAVVFAADSRLTTYGRAGYDTNGEPIVVPQTYENATKIVRDTSGTAMVVVTGSATLGTVSFMDYVASSAVPAHPDSEQHEEAIRAFSDGMGKLRAAYWGDVPVEQWPDTVLLLAGVSPSSHAPIVWRIAYQGENLAVAKVENRVFLEGSYRNAFTLLYGYDFSLVQALGQELKVGDQAIGAQVLDEAIGKLKVLKPIEQLNVNVMPLQDAMDLAFFLATTQVQMERFLPGEALCGGPIDFMVLKTAPVPEILWHPGKMLHHPGGR
jgi:hypothetical protein